MNDLTTTESPDSEAINDLAQIKSPVNRAGVLAPKGLVVGSGGL
jgi:hypothetical protein